MRHASFIALAPLVLACACSGKTIPNGNGGDGGAGDPGGPTSSTDGGPTPTRPTLKHTGAIQKVDLLFMIDNSASMADKQALLGAAVPELLGRLVSPSCVDAGGKIVGVSANGACASGSPEFPAIRDLHVGVVSSSLGGRGSDACPAGDMSPVNPGLSRHNDDGAHLITRGGADEHAVAGAASGFLAFAPGGDATKLIADFQDIVTGVHEYGCGYEAQLESWYRFLVQPDPYQSIAKASQLGVVSLVGVDDTVLRERHDFLRPDSLVGIVLLTDENDSTVDPLALGGQGWAYENQSFPGSQTGGGAPRGTSACASNPNDASCTSCGFCGSGQVSAICNDSSCNDANHGYYAVGEDSANERFFHMKQRFGVDPQFPISRYVNGLTSILVPDRKGEHPPDTTGVPSASYQGANNCTNPLFAASLPASASAELCNLPVGPRALDQVVFAVIGGVNPQLLHFDPANPASAHLSPADWTKVLGADPLHYDFTGADPHMLESITPRPGLPAPSASDTADPVNGREWDTASSDLQYACTFPLAVPKDCTRPENKNACDCENGNHPPLCDPTTPTTQIRAKAYPTIRELAVARELGDQAVVGSICALHATEQTANDPLYGYRPAVKAIGDHVSAVLGAK